MRRNARRKPLWRRALGATSYIFFCSLCLLGGAIAGWIGQSPLAKQIATDTLLRRDPKEAWDGRDHVTLLILGCDEDRYYGGKQILRAQARSDMMLVARLDFARNRITGVSIPRDTLAAPRGYREQKINAFHWIGGPDLSKAAVESILPVRIDRVVVLNYKAFEEMVDLVGGVELFVPKNMDYDDKRGGLHIHLKAGRRQLSGQDAVGFVRFRHSDDDFRRQQRQKDFLLAFKDSVMRNPTLLPQVAEKAREVMGGALSKEEISSLALFAKAVGNDNIKMGMVPTIPARRYDLRVDRSKLEDVLAEHHFLERFGASVSARR